MSSYSHKEIPRILTKVISIETQFSKEWKRTSAAGGFNLIVQWLERGGQPKSLRK
jgi:hypothetical protein